MSEQEIKVENLGGGIMLFRNAVTVNQDFLIPYLSQLHEKVIEEEFTIIHDDSGNEVYAVNRSGHRYSIDKIHMVNRIMGFCPDDAESKEFKFFRECEDAVYDCMIRYIEEFPMVLPSLWWREEGHVVAYRSGGDMGFHSDNDVNYQPGAIPDMQLATRHVVGSIIYFNDSVDSIDEIAQYEYVGGELEFAYLGVVYKPKAGDLIMFPSNYMGAHKVNGCFGGSRYAYISYFSHGSEDLKRGIFPVEKSNTIRSTQVWIPEIFNDYESRIKDKYGDTVYEIPHLTEPLNRKNTSSGTTEEVLKENAKNDLQ